MIEKELLKKAEAYLKLCYKELDKANLFNQRWEEVQNSIKEKGTYE